MKLYDLEKDSKIKLTIGGDGAPESEWREEICTFHHVDGMYSYITTPSGSVVHLSAVCPMKYNTEGGYYEVDDGDKGDKI
jgi:hypothetical protein